MSQLKESKTYSINDFINWESQLELSPKFQRNKVWNQSAKSYLIDSILRGMPIPPIFLTQKIDLETKKTIREVIDGQQRLTAIFEFKNNEITIQKSHNHEYGGLTYDQLPENIKIDFLEYEIPVEIIKTNDDAIIYDIFARLNTNNIVLNRQELRNSKYWGEFKVLIYTLSVQYKNFFIRINTFTNQQFSRMADSEFLSSLLILAIDGIVTETSTSTDNYYKRYDKEFLEAEQYSLKINECFLYINSLLDNKLLLSYFNKKVQFYTLFAVIYHIKFGLNNLSSIDISKIDQNNFSKFKNIINEIESEIDNIQDSDLEIAEFKDIQKFIDLHKTRTTNLKERKERIVWLLEKINKNFSN